MCWFPRICFKVLNAYGQPNASSFPPPHPPQEEQVVSWGVHFPAEARTTSSVVILAQGLGLSSTTDSCFRVDIPLQVKIWDWKWTRRSSMRKAKQTLLVWNTRKKVNQVDKGEESCLTFVYRFQGPVRDAFPADQFCIFFICPKSKKDITYSSTLSFVRDTYMNCQTAELLIASTLVFSLQSTASHSQYLILSCVSWYKQRGWVAEELTFGDSVCQVSFRITLKI